MLELIDIKKRYGSKEVLHGISIKFENGIYGLIGPNGSGKSTIMNIMSDVLDMSSGKILYNGTDIKELDDRYREKIGFLPQNVGYYPNFTAKKTIEYFGYLRGVNKKELDSNVEQVLRDVNLYENRNDKVKSFSGGMKQRLGIAIALLNRPKLLVLDEPVNGLDPIGIQDLRQMIRRFPEQGITVIVSSHILSEIEQTADYIGIIAGGTLGYQGGMPKKNHLEELFMKIAMEQAGRERDA